MITSVRPLESDTLASSRKKSALFPPKLLANHSFNLVNKA